MCSTLSCLVLRWVLLSSLFYRGGCCASEKECNFLKATQLTLGSRLSVFLDLFWSYLKINLPCSSCPFTSPISLYGSKLLETRLPEEHLCDPGGLSPGAQPQVDSSRPQGALPLWYSSWEWRHGDHYKVLLSPLKSVQCSEESGGAWTGILLAL